MDYFVQLIIVYKVPLLWTAIIVSGGCGLMGLASPKLLASVNSVSKKSIDTNRFFALLDKTIDTDRYLAKHGRIFGLCALVAAGTMYFQFA